MIKEYTMKKDSLCSKWCWKNWIVTDRRMKIQHSLAAHTKIISKWIKDLSVRLGTIIKNS